MLPRFANPNVSYGVPPNAIVLGKRAVAQGTSADHSHVAFFELGEWKSLPASPDSPMRERVPYIFGLGDIFKVAKIIIQKVIINVVHDQARRARTYKSRRDKGMNLVHGFLVVFAKAHAKAPACTRKWADQFAGASRVGTPYSANFSNIGNFIPSLIMRDRKPAFACH